jgi:hypothetical protein
VYFRENGSSKIYSVEQAKGRIGLTGSGGTRGNTAAEDHRHVPRCFRREAQEGTGTQESLPEGKVNRSTWMSLLRHSSAGVVVAEGSKEDDASWTRFLRELRSGVWKGVRLFVSDKCLGLVGWRKRGKQRKCLRNNFRLPLRRIRALQPDPALMECRRSLDSARAHWFLRGQCSILNCTLLVFRRHVYGDDDGAGASRRR